MVVAACGDGERVPWPSENPQQVAAAGDEVAFAYVAGVPVVAYRDGGAVRVARAVSAAPGGAEHWVVHALAGDGTGSPALIDVEGRAWVAYSDGAGALHVARAVVDAPARAGDWDDVVVDASGAQPSLAYRALVAGARRHTIGLAFHDPAGGDARYAWTNTLEPAAGDWTAVTVDADGDTGLQPALELYLDGDLRVAIAYHDATAGDLRYARAARTGQPAEPGDWDVVTLDSDGDVGRGAQVVGAGNQRTTFVYRDDTAGELVYLTALTDDAGAVTVDRRYAIARGDGARLLSVGSRPVVVHADGDGGLAVTRAAGFAPADASEWSTIAVGDAAHAVAVAPPPCGLEDVDGVGRVELATAYAGDGGLRFRYLTVESGEAIAHRPVAWTRGVQLGVSFALDGAPAVAYVDRGALSLARATTSAPVRTEDWETELIATGEPVSLAGVAVGDVPVLAYFDRATDRVMVARATGGAWSVTAVATAPGAQYVSLAFSGGRLWIAYVTAARRVAIARARNGAPAGPGDWELHELDVAIGLPDALALADIAGRPALLWVDYLVTWYAAPTVAVPTSAADWTLHEVGVEGGTNVTGSRLLEVAGRPAIIHRTHWWLSYTAASSPTPASSADWSSHFISLDNGAGHELTASIVDGVPTVAYWFGPPDGAALRLARAIVPDPRTEADWTLTTVDQRPRPFITGFVPFGTTSLGTSYAVAGCVLHASPLGLP